MLKKTFTIKVKVVSIKKFKPKFYYGEAND